MLIEDIKANLGKRFLIADPNGAWPGKVLGREQRKHSGVKGWEVEKIERDEKGKIRKEVVTVATEQVLRLYETYIPGDEEHWEYEEPQGKAPNVPPNIGLMPINETPGFDLVSPVALKVWMSLFAHALTSGSAEAQADELQHSAVDKEGCGQTVPCARRDGLEATWSVPQLAKAVGKKERSVHYGLDELAKLKWIDKEKVRADGGEIMGFRYWILSPPAELADLALKAKLDEAKEKLDDAIEEVRRVKKYDRRKKGRG